MPEIAGRCRTQPPPRRIIYEALTKPDRDPTRPWLILRGGEQQPTIAEAVEPNLVVWNSIWSSRPDAQIRFEFAGPPHSSTTLYWTLIVDEPAPDAETTLRMRKRVDELINKNLRLTFGQ